MSAPHFIFGDKTPCEQPSKLPVIVLPLALRGDLFSGVPVLDQPGAGDPKKIIERRMGATGLSFADAQHEIAFRQRTRWILW